MSADPLDLVIGDSATEHKVRLFPCDGISNQQQAERRAASALLAMIRSVTEFGRCLVKKAGGPAGSIECYTECTLSVERAGRVSELRPDGIIRAVRGKKQWTALVEMKVGSNPLGENQFTDYHTMGCELGFDQLITITNQPAQANGMPPVKVDGRRQRKCGATHWSWELLLREAELLADPKRGDVVKDADQAWMLNEWIRYVTNPAARIVQEPTLGEHWNDVLRAAQELRLKNISAHMDDVVAHWDGFSRVTGFRLRSLLGVDVQPWMFVRLRKDPERRLRAIREEAQESGLLRAAWRVPKVVDLVRCDLNLNSKRAHYWIELKAPTDGRPQTRIRWLLRQLAHAESIAEIDLQVHWDQGRLVSQSKLGRAIEDDSLLMRDTNGTRIPKGMAPKSFHLQWNRRLAKCRGKSSAPVLKTVSAEIEDFYHHVVAAISKPVDKPPQLSERKDSGSEVTSMPAKEPVAERPGVEVLSEGPEMRSSGSTPTEFAGPKP